MIKFNEKYNTDDFLRFVTGFLPEDFVEKEEDILIKKDRYKEITRAKVIGFCKSLDVHVLVMDHKRENDPRIAIATDAFKILADHWIHKALVIFKNSESENYRFSYLTISLDLNEKNKAVKKYSNARRFSFYLGTHAKVKTPEQQLVKKGRVKDSEDLLSRFSIEVVNKQFYLEVAKHFDELVSGNSENFVLPGVSKENVNIRKSFAVRLIGRLMFCWFLKQKRSDKDQLIPDGLLSSKIVSDNYYHDVVEPLFFGALNTSLDSRDIRSDLFDKVPYLNGGLFSPQSDDYYELDHETFASVHINTLKISDSWFKDFFELLETYNFTIDENTVFDQELSVDPEMLGRIFENLLAEINPETGSSERKRTGSFYTPRQIVEYMVDQSLLEYLKTKTKVEEKKLSALISYDLTDDLDYPLDDGEKQKIIDALESLKILDPACGSGAFPMGALQKIVYVLQQIDPDCTLWLERKLKGVPELYKQKIINEVKSNPFNYTRKLDVIKNSIFGVDIQPIAVDVSRLRCFLTLVVESEVDDSKPNRGIEPLPNLDFKFVCANTLIGLPKSTDNQMSAFEDHSGIIELSKIMSEYFSCNSQRKGEIRLKFINTQKDILNRTLSAFGKNMGELTQKLTLWDPFSNESNSWFDPEWMFGLEEKFDVVIGNPPYLRIQGLQETQAEIIPVYRKNYKSAKGSFDLYALFIERGLNFLSIDGHLAYIVPHKFFQASFGKELRSLITSKKALNQIVKFSAEQVFENPTTYTCLLFLSNQPKDEFKYAEVISMEDLNKTMYEVSSNTEIVDAKVLKKGLLAPTSHEWSFQAGKAGGILQTLNRQPQRLGDVVEKIFQGLATSADKIYVLKIIGEKETTLRLFSNSLQTDVEIEKDFLRPFLMGKDVHRYENLTPKNYVIFPYFISDTAELMSLEYIKDNYPNGFAYLIKHKEILEDREGGKFKENWWCFSRPQNMILYDRQKIMTPEIALGGQMSFDDEGVAHTTKVYSFVFKPDLQEDLKYWLGLLNSKVLWYFLSNTGYVLRGGYFTFKTNYLTPFPVKRIDFKNKTEKDSHDQIVSSVNNILNKKKSDAKADTGETESKIDELVCKLYGLNEDEIRIIETKGS